MKTKIPKTIAGSLALFAITMVFLTSTSLVSYAAAWEGADDFSSGISATNWQVYQQAHGQMIVQGTNGHASFLVPASTTNEQNAYIVWQGHPTVAEDWTVQIKGHNSAAYSTNSSSQLQLAVVNSATLGAPNVDGYRIAMARGNAGQVFNVKQWVNGLDITRATTNAPNTVFALRLVYHSVTRQIEAWYDPTATGSDWTKLDTISLSEFSPSMTATDTFTFAILSDTSYGPISEGEIWADDFQLTGEANGWLWSRRVASTINPDTELAIGMALDKQDNCYVTGWFDGTNDFGGVTLTNAGSGGQDIFVAKYNSVGALQWARRAGGSSTNWDVGRGLGVDTNGNVYVTGGFYGPADFDGTNLPITSGEEFFLAKYDNDGAIKWARSSTGGSDRVYGTGLAVDGAGNSYALATVDHLSSQATNITFGSTTVSIPANNGSPVMILVKYDDTGAVKWEQLMGGLGEVYATKVAVDATGNVYVRGTFFSTLTIGTSNLVVSAGSSRNMFLAKFDSSGGLKWIRHPAGGNVDEGGVAVDQAENVYVTGAFGGTPLNFGSITLTNVGTNIAHAFIAKYSSSGAILWARQAGGTNGGMVNGNVFSGFYLDVALDGKGNPYAAGLLSPNTTSPSDSGAAVVAKYNPTGIVSWAEAASGPPANPAASVAAKCALDANGNCYLAGWYQGTATFGTNVLQPQGAWNYFLAKVAPPASPTLGIAWTNGQPQLSVAGNIGSLFSLQWSPNLAGTNTPWQTLTTLTLTNRLQLYLDTSALSGINRFYGVGPPAL